MILCLAAYSVSPLTASSSESGSEMGHLMTTLVLQLAAIVIATRVFGVVFSRYLKQTKVLGELAAGMIIGPYALGSLYFPLLKQPLFPKNLT